MPKNNQSEKEDGQEKLNNIMGARTCPLRSATKDVLCDASQCQFWTVHTIRTEDGEATTFNCAFPLMAQSVHMLVTNLFFMRQDVNRIMDRLGRQPTTTETGFRESLTKEDMITYLQGYDELNVSATPDGIHITGWINDDTKRKEAIAWMKRHGGRFFREPTKFWFIKTKKEE